MKLANYIDENEITWLERNREKLDQFFAYLNGALKTDLYKEYEVEDSVALYQMLGTWLLANDPGLLLEALDSVQISADIFELQTISSVILSVTRNRKNADLLLDLLLHMGMITDFKELDQACYEMPTTMLGTIHFQKASVALVDDKIQEILKQEDLIGSCHETTLRLLEQFPKCHAVIAICSKNLNEQYYHSFLINEKEKVIDLTGNLVIDKGAFYQLYQVKEVAVFDYETYLKYAKMSQDSDESHTLMPLLRAAIYQSLKEE